MYISIIYICISPSLSLYIYIYICIYIHTYIYSKPEGLLEDLRLEHLEAGRNVS